MKVTETVDDLSPEEQAAQALIYSLVSPNKGVRATGKPAEGKKKSKRNRKKT